MSQASTPAKVCIRCGQDCSRRARRKDQHGRYHCEECLNKAAAAKHVPEVPADAMDDGPLPLLEEPAAAMVEQKVCPNCRRAVGAEAAICVGCGMDLRTGKRLTAVVGVDREGEKKKAAAKPRSQLSRREREIEESMRIARRAWINPIIMIAVGVGIMSIVYGSQAGAAGVLGYLIAFGIQLFIGLVVYFVCSIMWIGFDEPIPMTALRLAGVYALADVAFSLVGMVAVPGLGLMGMAVFIIPMFVYVGLLSQVMEIELVDAIIVALVTAVVRTFIGAMVVAWAMGLL